MDARTLAAAALGLASATAFVWLGAALMRRRLPPEHRAAGRAFALGWLLAGACAYLAALMPFASELSLAAAWGNALLGVAMLACIGAYLAYLVTGSSRAIPAVALLYTLLLGAVFAAMTVLHPKNAIATGWSLRFEFAEHSDAANVWIAVVSFLPVVVGSGLYLAMLPKAADRTQRWRILLVGSGLALWSSTALAARIVNTDDAFALARLAGALLALAAILAYSPPRWIRARWSIADVSAELPRRPATREQRMARRVAAQARLRELV